MAVIIIPNWLKVDKATIFFISISKKALILAINIVKLPTQNSSKLMLTKFSKFSKRKIKQTPAVTKVEEWTSEDTGVGAAIAAGSHALKGICALFVDAATIIKIITQK